MSMMERWNWFRAFVYFTLTFALLAVWVLLSPRGALDAYADLARVLRKLWDGWDG